MNNLKMLFDGLAAVGAVYCLAALIRMVGGMRCSIRRLPRESVSC